MTIACYVQNGGRRGGHERAEIRTWLATSGIAEQDVEWFADEGTIVPDAPRPGFERLRTAVAKGDIQAVVLWKLDRLGFRFRDGIDALADWCERGLKIVIVAPRLEFSGDIGRSLAGLLLGLTEMEQAYRRGRQAAGIADAKKRGAYKGRTRGTTKASPARVRELWATGLSVAEIAQTTGVSKRTVTRYLEHAGASEPHPDPETGVAKTAE